MPFIIYKLFRLEEKRRIKMDKIELIFNMYKDSVVISKPFKREMIKRYKLSDEEIRNLYIRIQNYQVNYLGGKTYISRKKLY